MNVWLIISSVLSLVLGVGHSVLGEWIGKRVLVKKIQSVQLSEITEMDVLSKKIVRLAWHATSIMWCGAGAIFLYSSFVELNNYVIIIRILSVTFLLIGFLSLFTAPKKVILFFAISITSWIGSI